MLVYMVQMRQRTKSERLMWAREGKWRLEGRPPTTPPEPCDTGFTSAEPEDMPPAPLAPVA